MIKNNKKALGLAFLILASGSSIKSAENFIPTVDAKTGALVTSVALAFGGACAWAYNKYAYSKRQDALLDETLQEFLREERERSEMLDQALEELEQNERREKAVLCLLTICALNAKQMLDADQAYATYLTKIDSIKYFCKEYAGPLPKHIYELATYEARNIGVDNVNFYLTNFRVAHAGQAGPYKILGLTPQTIDPSRFLRFGLSLGDWQHQLHRTLFHELCHLKCGHSSLLPEAATLIPNQHDSINTVLLKTHAFMGMLYEKSDKNCFLANEMEAELGACYYLRQLKNIRYQWQDGIEDDKHPTNEEHKRYITELLRRLDLNPRVSFDTVKELKALYLREKKSGIKINFDSLPSSSSSSSSSPYHS